MKVINRDGVVVDADDEKARRDIRFGAAIATVPLEPDEAEKFCNAMVERVVVEAQQREMYEHLRLFDEYASWCRLNGLHPLPAFEPQVVRFLLERYRDGLTAAECKRTGRAIADVHSLSMHPPKNLGKDAPAAFDRALLLAAQKLKDERVPLLRVNEQVPEKALAMFPDGVVPRRYHELAA